MENPFTIKESYIGAVLYPTLLLALGAFTSFLGGASWLAKGIAFTLGLPVVLATKLFFHCSGGLECIGSAILFIAVASVVIGFLLGWAYAEWRN